MISNTSQGLLGANASQTATTIVIYKADLPKLTPLPINTAESILAAILLQAWGEFEGLLVDESGEVVVDEMGSALGYDQRQLYEKLHLWFWKRQFTGGKVLDTFVMNAFVKPPTTYGMTLTANQLVY